MERADVELLLRGALEVAGGEPVVGVSVLLDGDVVDGFTCAEGNAVVLVDLFKCCLNAVYVLGHDVDVGHIQVFKPQANHMSTGRLQPQRLHGTHSL